MVFVVPGVWVVELGPFIAFQESKRISLGIDPFFYFERLCRADGIAPLPYRCTIEDIQVETTPWVETAAGLGRAFKCRDPLRESFKRVAKTDA